MKKNRVEQKLKNVSDKKPKTGAVYHNTKQSTETVDSRQISYGVGLMLRILDLISLVHLASSSNNISGYGEL